MQNYRCPVDDCVFTPKKEDRVPTLEGHPECPGPVCSEKYAGYFGGGAVVADKPVVVAKPAAGAATSVLQPPPTGQGW
jgi:hypothetical protein